MMNRMNRFPAVTAFVMGLMLTAGIARADEVVTTAVAEPDARIAGLVEDLSSDDFQTREQAVEELEQAGEKAVAPVAKAAAEGDLDLATRCVGIIESLFASKDESTKQAAKAALEELKKSEHKSVAQRAAAIVDPAPVPRNAPNLNGIRIRIAANANARNVRKVQVRVVNGQRTIDVEENGRKIHISDKSGKNIVVRIEEPDEKDKTKTKTKEVKADDLDDLKKKDPEAAKLYEKHAQNGAGGIRFNFNGGNIQGGNIQIRPLPARIRNVAPKPNGAPKKPDSEK